MRRIDVQYNKIDSGKPSAGYFEIIIVGCRHWITPEETKKLYNQLHLKLDEAFSDVLRHSTIEEGFRKLFEDRS